MVMYVIRCWRQIRYISRSISELTALVHSARPQGLSVDVEGGAGTGHKKVKKNVDKDKKKNEAQNQVKKDEDKNNRNAPSKMAYRGLW